MDAIFKALADPARRTLLDALRKKDGQSLQDLQDLFDMTRFGVMKHLSVLEKAGLIVSRKRGRFKYHYLNAVPLQQVIDRWIDPYRAKPAARAVLDLKSKLEGTAPMPNDGPKPDFLMQTFIRCTQDALWEALTDAEQMGAYHFLCNTVTGNAEPGNATDFIRDDGGTMLRQVTTELDPKSRIAMTFEPLFMGPDAPPSHMVYLIDVEGDVCKLTIEHYDMAPGQDGFAEGWARLAASLKSYLETGTPLKAPMS